MLQSAMSKVEELTIDQGNVTWFLMRMFRVTSSVSAKVTRSLLLNTDNPSTALSMVCRVLSYSTGGCNTDHDALITRAKVMYTKDQLIDEINKVDPTMLKTGQKSDLIERLFSRGWQPGSGQSGGSVPTMEQVLHDCSFMAPIKARDSMKIGNRNEKNILRWLPEALSHSTEGVLNVVGHRLTGLCVPKDSRELGTSPDAVLVLKYTERESDDHDDQDAMEDVQTTKLFSAVAEMKTRSSRATKSRIRATAHTHGRFTHLKISGGDTDSEKTTYAMLKDLIPDAGNRQQCLHHAVVMDSPQVLFIEATQIKIEYIVLIEFSQPVLRAYRTAIVNPIKQKLLWFHSLTKDSDLEPLKSEYEKLSDPGYAVDFETYTLVVGLCIMLEEFRKGKGKPLGNFKRLLPAIISAWNKLKGGVDVFSRLLSNVKPNHPGQSLHGAYLNRVIMTMVVNVKLLFYGLRLHRLVETGATKCSSYTHFKKLCNEVSVAKFLEQVCSTLQKIKSFRENPSPQGDDSAKRIKRSRPTGLHHVADTVNDRSNHLLFVDHIVGVIGTKRTTKRCRLCCYLCIRGKPHVHRAGNQTRYGCVQCVAKLDGRKLAECVRKQECIPLCSIARYEHENDTRTCFEIFHNPPFPDYCKHTAISADVTDDNGEKDGSADDSSEENSNDEG